MPISEINTPALLVDLDQLNKNINRMARFFKDKEAVLRPHIKTHKCPEIARLQIKAGAVGITCAKTSEAEVFADAGIEDILVANQITGDVKIQRLVKLAEKVDLKVAVDDPDNVGNLERHFSRADRNLGVLIEVDIGMQRCGVQPGQPVLELARHVESQPHLKLLGIQAYEGHLVLIDDPKIRAQKIKESFDPLRDSIELLQEAGFQLEMISGGGTGTYDISGTETPLTEIQVGSYVFMDQTYHPVRPEFFPAISVLSTVVSRAVPGRLVTDAGLKSMTSEFGWPELISGPEAEMVYLSEEHAVLDLKEPAAAQISAGEVVQFLPSHVCTTVNLHEEFIIHKNGKVVDVWPISARGCSK